MASSSDDNLDDSRKDDASPYDKAPTRKVSVLQNTVVPRGNKRGSAEPSPVLGLEEITLH